MKSVRGGAGLGLGEDSRSALRAWLARGAQHRAAGARRLRCACA
jgi:hypothetical protein